MIEKRKEKKWKKYKQQASSLSQVNRDKFLDHRFQLMFLDIDFVSDKELRQYKQVRALFLTLPETWHLSSK